MKRILLAALLGSAIAVPALAQDHIQIHYDNASLASAQGRAVLERRVAGAVRKVCGDPVVTGSLLPDRKVLACRVTAAQAVRPQIEQAVAQANRKHMTEVASLSASR